MKVKLKKLTSMLLVLCMVLGLLPVGVFADETETPKLPTELAAVTATVSVETVPEGQSAPDKVTVKTANMFLEDTSPQVYLQFSGLQPSTSYYFAAYYGETELDSTAYTANADGEVNWTLYPGSDVLAVDAPSELTITIGYDREYVDGEYVCHGMYAPASVTTHIVSSLPAMSALETNQGYELLSTADLTPGVYVYLPYEVYETLGGKSDLSAQLVGPDGTVYATSVSYKPSVGTSSRRYDGYDAIFNGSFNDWVPVCYLSTSTMYAAKPLVTGLYDLKIYEGGALLHTVEQLVKVVDVPLITSISFGGYDEYATIPGMDTARALLCLDNGDPNDFSVEIWCGDEKLGSSGDYRVVNAYDGSVNALYVVPLSEAVDYGEYTVKVVSDQTFAGPDSYSYSFSKYSTYSSITDVFFGSRYYANVVLTTVGYDPEEVYKAVLLAGSNNGTELASAFVSPDENGVFDIEFTDENGDLIPISGYDNGNVNGHYGIRIYTQNETSGAWTNYQGKSISNYERYMVGESASLLSTDETIPVNVDDSSASFYAGEAYAYLRLQADSENYDTMSDLSKFSLRVTGVLGDVYTLTELMEESKFYANEVEEGGDGKKYYILTFNSDAVPFGNYTFELLYNGIPVVHASESGDGKNVLAQSYVSANDDFPYAQTNGGQNSVTGLIYDYGVYGYNLTADTLRVDLFTLTNRTTTPDISFEVASPKNRDVTDFTAEQLAKLSPITQYRSEIYQNDVPVRNESYAYYALREDVWTTPAKQTTHSVTAAEVENGTLTILPATDPTVAANAIPALTDVYVLGQPAEGYQLKPGSITVNGEPLLGRGFPVTEDAVVSAEFEPIPVKTYKVNVYSYIYNGTLSVDKEKAAAGETVTVTLTPNTGYAVNKSSVPNYWLSSDSGTRIDLTEQADGTWTFTMPEGAVYVTASFRTLRNWTVTLSNSDSSMGTLSVDNASPVESSTVVVTAVPEEGYELLDLTWSHRDSGNYLVSGDLTTTPGTDPNTYILTVPSKDDAYTTRMTVTATFGERQAYEIAVNSNTSGYGYVDWTPDTIYAGDTVTLTAYPFEGYRLVEGSLRVTDANGTELALTQQADGTWTFTMPVGNLNLFCEFEEKPLIVPGGTVTSPETLLTALGGTEFATLEGSTVTLKSDVVLESALNITAGTMTLDLNAHRISGPTQGNLLALSGTAELTVTNSAGGTATLMSLSQGHAIYVADGKLEIHAAGIQVFGNGAAMENAGSTLLVEDGEVNLGTASPWNLTSWLMVEEYRSGIDLQTPGAPALEIAGGTVNLIKGNISGETVVLVRDSGNFFMSGGDLLSIGEGPALLVDDTAIGTVKVYNGLINGEELGLIIQSEAAAVHLEKCMISGMEAVFRAPAGKGLKDYLANGSQAANETGKVLSSEQLAASELAGHITVSKAYSVSVSEAQNGRIWVEGQAYLPTFEVVVSTEPATGYRVKEITYTYIEEDGEQMTGWANYTAGMGYWFPMPEADVTVSAVFEEIPEGSFLQTNRFSIHTDYWNSSMNVSVCPDYNTSYATFKLVNAAGEVVCETEQHGVGTWFELRNPGGLTAGKYKLYAVMGDANQTLVQGWQTVELVDAYSYYANGNLTIWTAEFDANVSVECLPSQLPDGLKLELVDYATNRVLASGDAYELRYEGGGTGTATNDKDEAGACSSLRFHLDLGDERLSASGNYGFRLVGETELLNRNTNSLYIQTYPSFQGEYDDVTMAWTGTVLGISAGSYEAYSNNRVIDGLTCVVADDGTATVQFASDPFEAEGQSWVNINVNVNGTVYAFGFSNGQGNEWYQLRVDGLAYVNYNGSDSIWTMIPYPADGSYTIQATVPGYTGAGTYLIRDNYSNTLASGALDAQGGFSAQLTNLVANEYYQLWVYNEKGANIAQTDVRFRHDMALGYTTQDDLYDGDSTLTMLPLNIPADRVSALSVGYTTLAGREPLPVAHNADGTLTVDLSAMPAGRYRLWASFPSEDGGTCSVIITSNAVDAPEQSGSAVTVADLKPVKGEDDNVTAQVKYEGGTPAADVLMDIYTLRDGVLTFCSTENIGKSSYTIDGGELGLSGSYVFYFRSSADNSLLGVKKADFVGAYAVTFLDWDGSVLSVQQVEPGTGATAPEIPEREGYTFAGWSGDFSAVTRNLTVTARYTKNAVTVTFFVGVGANGPEPVTLTNGSILTKPETQPQRDGYDFNGWYTNTACTKSFDFDKPVTADTILYAGWVEKDYVITTSGSVGIIFWSESSSNGLNYAGDTIRIELDSPNARITALKLLDEQGELLQNIPVAQESLALWTACFTMPAQNVTVCAETEVYAGELTIQCNGNTLDTLTVNCYEGMYSEFSWNFSGDCLTCLPYGTYYVTGTIGSLTISETVTLTAEAPSTFVNMYVPDDRYAVSGTISGAGETLWLYAYNQNTGAYAGCADYDYKSGTFTIDNLANGSYDLCAYDDEGQLRLDVTSFTVSDADRSDLLLTVSRPLSVVTQVMANAAMDAQTAYIYLEKEEQNGLWSWVYSQSIRVGDTAMFPNVISEAGNYRVRLDWLTRSNGSGISFESDPVTFTVTENDLDEVTFWTDALTFTPSLNVMTAFSGSGNVVALSKSAVYPGDYVDLTIRYSADAAVAPAFTLTLPEGVQRLDENSLTVTDPAQSGTIRLALKVDKDASGALAIPVKVTLNGQTTDFGTAAMSVAGVTLSAEPSVQAQSFFHVSGEAAPGSTVEIFNVTSGTLLASVPVSGRFYSAKVVLPVEGTYELQAQVSSGGNVVKSEKVSVNVTTAEPVRISSVLYNYSSAYGTGTNAKLNPKLNQYTFYQYVDMDLMGWALPIRVGFKNVQTIESVTFRFCGQTYTVTEGAWENGELMVDVTFPEKQWGGSGLKAITAEVMVYDYAAMDYVTYHFDVALVNLLIDPSGVVTDENGDPLAGVTVTCQVLENGQWVDWNAADSGQVNPQVTDADGRYGWNVPEGTYRVLATKNGYLPYDSSLDEKFGNLDIPPARNDIDFSMTPVGGTYAIVPTLTEGASVTAASAAASGSSVTLTVEPMEGLLVESVQVTTLSGAPVKVTEGEDNTYTFKMPAQDVTFRVTTASQVGSTLEIQSASSGSVTVSLTKLEQDATLFAAFYAESGRMVGLQSVSVAEGAVSATAKAELSETAAYVRVFLLDPTARTPLLASDQTPVN